MTTSLTYILYHADWHNARIYTMQGKNHRVARSPNTNYEKVGLL